MGRTTLTFDDVARLGLSLPGTEQGTSYGSPALKVKGRMYACIAINKEAEPDTLAVRIPMAGRDELLADEPQIFYLTPHYQDYACVLVRLARINARTLAALLGESHRFMSQGGRVVQSRRRREAAPAALVSAGTARRAPARPRR